MATAAHHRERAKHHRAEAAKHEKMAREKPKAEMRREDRKEDAKKKRERKNRKTAGGPAVSLKPTAEDRKALAEYRASNGHAANHALEALAQIAVVPEEP